jgi:mono/diheme cytochrome c family protein
MHIDKAGAGFAFNGELYAPYYSSKEVEAVQPATGGLGDVVRKGKVVYSGLCQGCHQASGLGAAGQAPQLAGSEWVLAEGSSRVIRIVLHGLSGPITVAGKPFNGAMTALGPALSDEEIAAVLTYIKNAKEWGHETGQEVTPEQVSAIREAESARTSNWMADELMQIELQ